ncbi:nucleotide exchange factor GrpE [Candidatus Wolfebacteria bacterium CG10_big_fil_rev_8_21_14_0_10_31_9]|uniref:Protein GrpE n=1 Tax=Candidatus Wolfebacteria bacterium CG10_big_fil_rev_8_21_14_0_10_31_9 TaxID=1975070 RepID=A0A2H0RDT1_9BACT|nr:MAG: nucleotide exchange factor GrpE [Candidatus Wolfebacteria bacterium CG10_big_fil_rev_8_21_14_0_10_31_9]
MGNEIKGNNQNLGEDDKDLESEAIKKERAEYLDGWQRARAELINYKKDESKRFDEFRKISNVIIVRDLINVLDSFDLALEALEKDGKAEKGLYLIRAQFEDVLKSYGLEKIIISIGNLFDPLIQEAIAEVESDELSGTIIEEVEKGYALYGKVIRPSKVKISK